MSKKLEPEERRAVEDRILKELGWKNNLPFHTVGDGIDYIRDYIHKYHYDELKNDLVKSSTWYNYVEYISSYKLDLKRLGHILESLIKLATTVDKILIEIRDLFYSEWDIGEVPNDIVDMIDYDIRVRFYTEIYRLIDVIFRISKEQVFDDIY